MIQNSLSRSFPCRLTCQAELPLRSYLRKCQTLLKSIQEERSLLRQASEFPALWSNLSWVLLLPSCWISLPGQLFCFSSAAPTFPESSLIWSLLFPSPSTAYPPRAILHSSLSSLNSSCHSYTNTVCIISSHGFPDKFCHMPKTILTRYSWLIFFIYVCIELTRKS